MNSFQGNFSAHFKRKICKKGFVKMLWFFLGLYIFFNASFLPVVEIFSCSVSGVVVPQSDWLWRCRISKAEFEGFSVKSEFEIVLKLNKWISLGKGVSNPRLWDRNISLALVAVEKKVVKNILQSGLILFRSEVHYALVCFLSNDQTGSSSTDFLSNRKLFLPEQMNWIGEWSSRRLIWLANGDGRLTSSIDSGFEFELINGFFIGSSNSQ